MNLQQWIADDHANLASRLIKGVVQRVPADRWQETPIGGGSSLAWLLLHTTVHQDVALNCVVRNHAPMINERRARSRPWALPECRRTWRS